MAVSPHTVNGRQLAPHPGPENSTPMPSAAHINREGKLHIQQNFELQRYQLDEVDNTIPHSSLEIQPVLDASLNETAFNASPEIPPFSDASQKDAEKTITTRSGRHVIPPSRYGFTKDYHWPLFARGGKVTLS